MTAVDDKYFKSFPRKLYRFLEEGHVWKFQKMKNNSGEIFWYPECHDQAAIVTLDHRDDVLSTLIHEVLHYLHPNWNEEEVIRMEEVIIRNLSQRQIKNILKRWASVL